MKSLTRTVSPDGTPIAYETLGQGDPVVLIGGAFNDRQTVAGVAHVLSSQHTAVVYDRRGRGDSGDGPPPGLDREIEDLAVLIAAVRAPAALFGHSSGAALALEAAAAGLPVSRLAVYEPSYVVGRSRPRPGTDLADRIQALVAVGSRDAAAALFLSEAIGMPDEVVGGMQSSPVWAMFAALAHTLPYDLAACRGMKLPTRRLSGIPVPVLAIHGSNTTPWLAASTEAVASAVPGARHAVLEGQDHGVLHNPDALGPVLREFLA